MESDLDPNIIKATQTSLGKYVKRPPLSDKLLKKPPFRFLHDIVTSVLKSTGFFNGLFDENELISDNVKDRDAKISFLNKIIYVVGRTTGEQLLVKPSKIVAGQEPEKTNELLQCLALALDKKLTSDDAVKQFKHEKGRGAKEDKHPKGPIEKIDSKKKGTPREIERSKKGYNQGETLKNKSKETVKVKKESPPKITSQQNKLKSKEKPEKTLTKAPIETANTNTDPSSTHNIQINTNESINLEKNIDSPNEKPRNNDLNTIDLNQSLNTESSIQTANIAQVHSPRLSELNELNLASTEKTDLGNADLENTEKHEFINDDINGERIKVESDFKKEIVEKDYPKETDKISANMKVNDLQNIDVSNIRPPSARPASSRPGAPRVRERHENNVSSNNITIIGKVNIISENLLSEENEEASIVIENNIDHDGLLNQPEHVVPNQHGHLVQQILDSQKEFTNVSGRTEIEWQFDAQKARDDTNKDIDQLRFNIQALSRIANPLGKLLDHIQEDVEVMRQESLQWIQTYEESYKELLKQKTLSEELLLPLHSKISQLETEITEKQEKINDLKIIIYKNNSRIDRLLVTGNMQ
ncbi:unnamed protein product [Colias eurytheme]|nr:unnamed protein product [Colias eurytheme]